MYIAVVDDNRAELECIVSMIEKWKKLNCANIRIKSFTNASELLDSARNERFTLFLLDVLMPGINGIEAAYDLRSFDDAADIVFLTSSKEFACDSYRVKALDYLIKPVEESTLLRLIEKLYLKEKKPLEGFSAISGGSITRILFSELSFVEVKGRHIRFNLYDGTVKEVTGSLKAYETLLLKRPEFIKVHRSFIANISHISEFSASGMTTFSKKTIPVSRKIYPSLQKAFSAYLFDEKGSDKYKQ